MDKLKEFCKIINNECIDIKTQVKRIDGEYTVCICWETSHLINNSATKKKCRWEGFETMEELIDDLINTFKK